MRSLPNEEACAARQSPSRRLSCGAPMDVRIKVSSRDAVFALWDRVALALWRGKTTSGAVRRGSEILAEHAAAWDGRVLLLTVVEENVPLPALEARMELVSLLKNANGLVERSALVFEGEGFRAASVRAVVAGVSLFSRPEYPHRVFASVGAAARFLGGGRKDAPAPHRVIRMVNEARHAPGTQTFLPWLAGANQTGDGLRPR